MVKLTFFQFLREQWAPVPLRKANLRNRSILLTGANSGLGLEAAKHLVEMTPRTLVLPFRNVSSGEATVKGLSSAKSPDTAIVAEQLDLTSFQSVIDLVDKLDKDPASHIDTLVANAGKATRIFEQTKDGWESTVQVNYLSNALLSILLLPRLMKTASKETPSRIAFVSSDGHHFVDQSKTPTKDVLDTLNDEKEKFSTPEEMKNRYNVSKLLLLMFARELSARIPEETPVSVMSINPGFCYSNITRETESTTGGRISMAIVRKLMARSTEAGGRTLVHAVTAEDPQKLNGEYVSLCAPVGVSDFVESAQGQEMSKEIWADTIKTLSKVDPRVSTIIANLRK